MSEPLHCSHTTIQGISDASPWPEHLSPIADQLRLFFPCSIDQVDTSKLSSDGLALYRELIDTCTAVPRLQMDSSFTPLTDIIDTTLLSVAQLRLLARRPGTENARESTAISLLHILGLVCSPNAVAIAGAPFLLPRSLPPSVLERLGCEGYTSLLVGVSVHAGLFVNKDISVMEGICLDGKLKTTSDDTATLQIGNYPSRGDLDPGESECTEKLASEHSTSSMEVDRCDETWSLSNAAGAQVQSTQSMAASDTKSSTNSSEALLAPSIPFDGHVLPGGGVRTSCYLPALCVANETNINALITSAAYQRHVFGISLPVVGICLYNTPDSIFARVMIGWIDGMVEDCRIPSVRVATAMSIFTNSPSAGVFDLCDPCAAILLSQFVLSLSFHVNALSSTLFAPADQAVSWRADQTVLYSPSLNRCCMHFAKELSHQIQSLGPQTDISANSTLFSVDMPEADLLCDTNSSTASHIDDAHPSTLTNPSDTKTEETLRAPSSVLSRTFESTSCICKNLHTRGIIVLAAVHDSIDITGLNGDMDVKERVRDKVYETLALYFSITSPPDWPNGWTNGTSISPSDPAYEYLQNKLSQEIKAYQEPEPEGPRVWEKPLLTDFHTDDSVGFELFSSHVSLFFLSVATMRKSLSEKLIPGLQGDNKFSWDWVFQIACSKLGDTLGRGNWSERPIALPAASNKTVADWCQFFAVQLNVSLDQGSHLLSRVPGSRWITHYFSDALVHIEGLESDGENALPSCQNQDADDTSIMASLLVAEDTDKGVGYVTRHVTSMGPSFCPNRTPGDSLTTLAVLHRQSSQTGEQALDRCCLCMVSLLLSLKSAGLSGTPVFGVLTDRTECTLLTAMQDPETGYNLVLREAAVRYDLTKPLDALLFFMTLHRIFRRQSELFTSLQ